MRLFFFFEVRNELIPSYYQQEASHKLTLCITQHGEPYPLLECKQPLPS